MSRKARERIAKSALEYLEGKLDPEVKKRISESDLSSLLSCLSNWIYDGKMRAYLDLASDLRQSISVKAKSKSEDGLGNPELTLGADDFYNGLNSK